MSITIILCSVYFPWLLGTGLIYLELDPFSFILREINYRSSNNVLILAMKCLMCYYSSHIGWYGISSVLLIMLIELHYGYCLISKGLDLVTDLTRTVMHKKPSFQLKRELAITREVLYTIKLMRLILPLADEAFYVILPFLLLLGEMVFVSCTYATIKMYDSIPMPFFLVLPSLACAQIIFLQIALPFAANVLENSKSSLLLLKALKIVHKDKIWIRTIRATRPPRFNFGSMFYAKQSTKITCFECWLNDTINILLFKEF